MAIQKELTALEKIRKEESDIKEIGEEIERLRAAYERYFMGMERTEPWVQRGKMDKMMRLNETLSRSNRTTVRFRWNALVRKYQAYVRYWDRICRQIEEGTYSKDRQKALRRAGHAAHRDSPRARRRKQKEEAERLAADGQSAAGDAAESFLSELGLAPTPARRDTEPTALSRDTEPMLQPITADGPAGAPTMKPPPPSPLETNQATLPPPLPGAVLPRAAGVPLSTQAPPPVPPPKLTPDDIRGRRASALGRDLQSRIQALGSGVPPSMAKALEIETPSQRQQTSSPPPMPPVSPPPTGTLGTPTPSMAPRLSSPSLPPAAATRMSAPSARPGAGPEPARPSSAPAPRPSAVGPRPSAPTSPAARSQAQSGAAEFQTLYSDYISALDRVGKRPQLSYEKFADAMNKKQEAHTAKYKSGITYGVSVKDGNVTITAKRNKE